MTKQPILAGALLATLGLFTACQTTSTTTSSAGAARFAKADTNKDGKLTRTECGDFLITGLFESRDANHDGKLTWAEWNVPGAQLNQAKFKSADTNKDGALSLDEAIAYGRKKHVFTEFFTAADTNKDGYLSLAEAQAYYGSKEGPPN